MLRKLNVNILVGACVFLMVTALLGASGLRAAEPVKIRVAWLAAVSDLAPVIFQKTDIMKNYGKSYAVELINFKGTSPQISALAAKQLDIAISTWSSIAFAISKAKLDIKVVAHALQEGVPGYFTTAYVVLESSNIRSPKDLRGKTVAVNAVGGTIDFAMRLFMRKHGMEADKDYNILEVAYAHNDIALREGKVDAAVLIAPFWNRAMAQGGVRPLFTLKDALSWGNGMEYIARTDFLRQNHQAALDFFEDFLIGLRWFLDPSNYDEAIKITSKFFNIPERAIKGWAYTNKDYYRDPDGLPDLDALQKNLDLGFQEGYLDAKVDISKYVDLSYIKEAKRRLGK